MSNSVEINKLQGLSYAELRALLEKTEAALTERRTEELKVLADGYAKKLQMNGFTIAEGMDALKPYQPAKAPKAGANGEQRKAKYANPDDAGQTWGGMGKQPKWFKDQLASGRAREDMQIR